MVAESTSLTALKVARIKEPGRTRQRSRRAHDPAFGLCQLWPRPQSKTYRAETAVCSDRCRDQARKSRKSAFRGTVLGVGSRRPRNAQNPSIISRNCRPDFGGRASVDAPLWRAIVETEIFGGRAWDEVTSRDGVRSLVARLSRSALVRP